MTAGKAQIENYSFQSSSPLLPSLSHCFLFVLFPVEWTYLLWENSSLGKNLFIMCLSVALHLDIRRISLIQKTLYEAPPHTHTHALHCITYMIQVYRLFLDCISPVQNSFCNYKSATSFAKWPTHVSLCFVKILSLLETLGSSCLKSPMNTPKVSPLSFNFWSCMLLNQCGIFFWRPVG